MEYSNNQKLAIIGLIGLALLGLAYGGLRNAGRATAPESSLSITDLGGKDAAHITPQGARSVDSAAGVVVHVAGCVKKPGVYTLSAGARVVDAVHSAGGPGQDADLDSVNLAARVKDGQQITLQSKRVQVTSMIPMLGVRSKIKTSSSKWSASTLSSQPQQIININTANIAELDQLPGVGPSTAQKIIDYRSQIGQFTSIDQILEVKGIGPKKLEKIAPYIRL